MLTLPTSKLLSNQEKEDLSLKLSSVLKRRILAKLRKELDDRGIQTSDISIVQIFPERIAKDNDVLGLQWKAQVSYKDKLYYVEVWEDYYLWEKKLWKSVRRVRMNILKRIQHRIMNPSPENRRWRALKAVNKVATRVMKVATPLKSWK